MTRSVKAHGPASAEALHQALAALQAAPTADPARRPQGPVEEDAPLLLGVLLAKTELDAAVKADPGEEPPDGLLALLAGYRAQVGRDDQTHRRLIALRLIRTAFEITSEDGPGTLAEVAGDAAMAAANLVNACGARDPNERQKQRVALESAARFNHDVTLALERALGTDSRRAAGSTVAAERRPRRRTAQPATSQLLSAFSKTELYTIASRLNVSGRSSMNRAELIHTLSSMKMD